MGNQFSLRYFQHSIVNHRQVGFTVPLNAWFRDSPDRPRARVDQPDFTQVGQT
jgi:hypothetical protein